jgi:splicing factor 3A subunit 1
MEEDSSSSSEDESDDHAEQKKNERIPTSLEPPRQDQVIIKKDYDPKQARTLVKEVLRPVGPEEYTISPITGERIPVSKLQEHMRIGLLDPRWKDQRDKQIMEKQNQESVYAPGKLFFLTNKWTSVLKMLNENLNSRSRYR